MEKEKKQAFALLVVTFFLWGSVYVGAKMISGNVPTPLLACLRTVVGALCVRVIARPYRAIKLDKEDRGLMLFIGFLGYYVTVNLVQLGIALTGASVAALINALTPVSVTIFAAILLGEKITPIKIACLVLALAGTVVITGGNSSGGELIGVLVMLASVITWGLNSVQVRKLTSKYPPVLVTAWGLAISLMFHIPTGIVSYAVQGADIDLRSILVIVYLGLTGTGISHYTWAKSLSILPASTCSLFYPLQPLFSAILGALILSEQFRPSFFIGLALICADVVLNTLESRRESGARKNS